MGENAEKICFVISPIGETGTEIRKRADKVLRHVIAPAVLAKRYSAVRADKISEPGLITSQVIQHLVDDDLVVADLTGSNPNVFYELAIRHAARKPYIHLIEKDEKIPFDLAGMRTIPLDHRDLDNVESVKEEIIRQIESLEGKKSEEIDTPISASIQIQQLKQSGNPVESSLANLVNAVSEIKAYFDGFTKTDTSSLAEILARISNVEHRVSLPELLLPASYFRIVSKEFNLRTRSFRTIINETIEFMTELERNHVFDEEQQAHANLKKRMQFVMHMINRELEEE